MGHAPAEDRRVVAVLAAYPRRELTLACVHSLRAQHVPGVMLDVFGPARHARTAPARRFPSSSRTSPCGTTTARSTRTAS